MNGMAFIDRLTMVLEENEIPYAIVGGLAAIAWGVPRFTQDVDMVAALPLDQKVLTNLGKRLAIEKLSAMEAEHFAEVAIDSIKRGITLSFMTPAIEKIDISPTGTSIAGMVAEYVLRLRCQLETPGGNLAWFATPEGTIVGKLYFYWLGSDRQLKDIANILLVQRAAGRELDLELIGEWAQQFNPGLYQIWFELLDAVQ